MLLQTIAASGAETVGVTHDCTAVLSRWLTEHGVNAYTVNTHYSGENDDESEAVETEE